MGCGWLIILRADNFVGHKDTASVIDIRLLLTDSCRTIQLQQERKLEREREAHRFHGSHSSPCGVNRAVYIIPHHYSLHVFTK